MSLAIHNSDILSHPLDMYDEIDMDATFCDPFSNGAHPMYHMTVVNLTWLCQFAYCTRTNAIRLLRKVITEWHSEQTF